MHESARPATPDDLPEIERLVEEGRASIADARGGALWLARQAPPRPVVTTYASMIESPDALVTVACIDDVPLGFLAVEVEHADGVALAVARELYVTDEARGVGLGELMMDDTVAWAAGHGCIGIDGYALPGDRATKNFFETFGLVARGIVVHRSLDRS